MAPRTFESRDVSSPSSGTTIVKINNIYPIDNADNIVLAEINGWKCVVKKNDFNIGDFAIYFCIDSIPDLKDPNMEFLVNMKIKKIKTIKIRGVISQGLLGNLKLLTDRGYDISILKEGDDVTKEMGVTKYVNEEEYEIYQHTKTKKSLSEFSDAWPNYIPKTDEDRLQNKLKYLTDIAERNIVITRKEDGCSCTFIYNNGNFLVCSRNFVIFRENENSNNYYFIADKFNICKKMTQLGKNIAIQGEIVGPKINGNKLKLTERDFRVFNIYDIENKCYLLHDDVTKISQNLELNQVPLIYRGLTKHYIFNNSESYDTLIQNETTGKQTILAYFLKLADDIEYSEGIHAEGIVIKTNDVSGNKISFKVISNEFLLANDTDIKKVKKQKNKK